MKSINDLPLELLQHIASMLSLRDSIALSGACRRLSRINQIAYHFKYNEEEVKRLFKQASKKDHVNNLMKLSQNKSLASRLMTEILMFLAKEGLFQELTSLLKDKRCDLRRALGVACSAGNHEIVELLLEDTRIDPSGNNNEAIIYASYGGHFKVVELLLQYSRVDPSANNNYAIRFASTRGYLEIVELLLRDQRVDPTEADNHAIRWTSRNGHSRVVEILLEDARVDPSVMIMKQ